MIFFILILALTAFSSAKAAPAGSFRQDYLSREKTAAVKGIFVVLVFLSHARGYFRTGGIWDEAYLAMQDHLGQMVVAMFFFYSGYGMMEQTSARGYDYVRSVTSRRLPKLLLDFDTAVVLYLLVNLLRGTRVAPGRFALALVAWTSLGNSDWFIFAMLGLYLLCAVAFLPLRRSGSRAVQAVCLCLLTGLSAGFAAVLMRCGKPEWWYNTLLLFSAGYWYSFLRPGAERVLMRNDFLYSAAACGTLAVYLYAFLHRADGFGYYTLWGLCFTALTVLLTMKVSLESNVLRWFGEHVFSIYIIQRIPMMLLSRVPAFGKHRYMFVIAAFAATIPSALIFEALTGKLEKLIWRQPRASGTARTDR